MQSRLKREAHVSWVHENDNKAKSDGLILWERSGTGSNGKFLYALAHVMGGTTVGEITMISGVYSNVRNFFLSFAIILWTVDNWDIIFRKKRWSQLCSIASRSVLPTSSPYAQSKHIVGWWRCYRYVPKKHTLPTASFFIYTHDGWPIYTLI